MSHSALRQMPDEDALICAAIGLAPNIAKGYYDRQTLTVAERGDYNMLRGQGVPEAEARALAWALNGRGRGKVLGHLEKRSEEEKKVPLSMQQRQAFEMWRAMGMSAPDARRLSLQGKVPTAKSAGDPYIKAFHDAAKTILPGWLHQEIHVKARASAGGKGAKVARLRQDETKAEQLADIDYIKRFLKTLEDEVVAKGTLTRSDVHVPVPVELAPKPVAVPKVKRKKKPKAKVKKAGPYSDLSVEAALAAPNTDTSLNASDPIPLDAAGLMHANRLVAGMDAEMLSGNIDPEEARNRASRVMLERPDYYDGLTDEPELRGLGGLDVDLGSGNSRSLGFLGIDLYPYDYGTIIHDLDMGIPLPDGCVRSLHARNVMEQMFGADGDPTPLMEECRRVLMVGGQLLYEGGQSLLADDAKIPLPGLELVVETGGQTPGAPIRQVFERVPIPVPAYHGALAPYQTTDLEGMTVAEQLGLREHNEAPADVVMANLIHKNDMHTPGQLAGQKPKGLTKKAVIKAYGKGFSKVVPIIKSEDWRQIVYGVVLAPNELDSQNDWMTPADIEEAAHHYLATSRIVGTEHSDPISAIPVESFIAPQDLDFNGQYGPTRVTKGSWVLGVKINDPAEWNRVISGDYTGFSVGGFGIRE